jgi:hypothetical protein
MPRSKHRRKPGGKAVANPGRGKPGKPVTLDHLRPAPARMDAPARVVGVDDLPLFDWAEPQNSTEEQA